MSDVVGSLGGNAALLLALVYLYGQIRDRLAKWDPVTGQLLTGALFGLFGVINMLNPLSLAPGVIVDMRIVMIICAILLSGWRAGIVAVFIIAAYRISLGGSGATAGVVTLISTFIIISLYDLRHGNATERPIEAASVTIGVVLFNQALGYMLLPEAVRIPFLQNTTLPFLLLYPLATSTVLMIVQRRDHYLSLLDKLQQSEQRFRAIFDQTFQFIGLLKPDGTLIEANKTALSFAGVTLDEIAGKPYWETRWWTVNKETQEELRAAIRRASNGEFVRYEVEVLGHNDQTVTIDFSLNPIKNEHGKVVMIIPEGRDISDQLVARQREIDLQMEQESSHLMREFIAHSAHHLRTPITVVKSTLFVCQKRLDQFIAGIEATTEIHVAIAQSLDHATRLSDRFKACEKATDKLSDLVNDMLQISSLNWKENIVYTEEDIVAVTQNCVREFEDVAAMKKINLRLFLPQEAIQMKMDVSHIHTALGNLLKNAFHYTQAGGTVKVRLDRTGDEVSITVTDTGIGIEKENLTRVFDQFYRADNGMQANPEGTGLGLPFVKKVAEKHNGMVMVTSEITKGSSFTIRLPVHHNIQETQRPEQFRQEA